MEKQTVNYITHLNSFGEFVRRSTTLHPNHLSLYYALFQTWNQFHFTEMFPINRKAIKRMCRIGSNNTYAQCLKDLHASGLITYMPSAEIGMPSYISMTLLNSDGGLIVRNFLANTSCDTIFPDMRIKTAIDPCINTDTAERMTTDTRIVSKQISFIKQNNLNKEKRACKQKGFSKKDVDNQPDIPLLGDVLTYFTSAGFSINEARKFFFHYMAIGWTINGKPIRNWQYAAQKWSLNTDSFTLNQNYHGNNTPGGIRVDQNKRYDVPL